MNFGYDVIEASVPPFMMIPITNFRSSSLWRKWRHTDERIWFFYWAKSLEASLFAVHTYSFPIKIISSALGLAAQSLDF